MYVPLSSPIGYKDCRGSLADALYKSKFFVSKRSKVKNCEDASPRFEITLWDLAMVIAP
jgi:hypothetical protein